MRRVNPSYRQLPEASAPAGSSWLQSMWRRLKFNVRKRLVFILFVSNFQTAYRLSWETGPNVQKNKQVVWGWGRSMWLVIGFSHHRSHLRTRDPPPLFKNHLQNLRLRILLYFVALLVLYIHRLLPWGLRQNTSKTVNNTKSWHFISFY